MNANPTLRPPLYSNHEIADEIVGALTKASGVSPVSPAARQACRALAGLSRKRLEDVYYLATGEEWDPTRDR